jgi:hypothetical protein
MASCDFIWQGLKSHVPYFTIAYFGLAVSGHRLAHGRDAEQGIDGV